MRTGIALALAIALIFGAVPATAQEIEPAQPLSPDESALLAGALAAGVATTPAPKLIRVPGLSGPTTPDISRKENWDGSATVAVKDTLPLAWDAKVGADLGYSGSAPRGKPATFSLPADGPSAGGAWASVGLAPRTTVDARIDAGNDRGKLATSFKQSVPVGSAFAVTLQNSFSLTETFGEPQAGADIPLTALPAPASAPWTPQVWGNEKTAKFDVLTSGTSLAASLASSTSDPVTHRSFKAEQKLYGPLHVTTAMNDPGQPTASKSITAGFKLNW